MEQVSREMRFLIHHISTDLTTENVKGLCFLFGLSNPATGRCCCCSQQPLDVLEHLLREGFYGRDHLAPLVDALKELGRQDLASDLVSKSEELPPTPGLPLTPPPSPETSAGPVVQCTERDCIAQNSQSINSPPTLTPSQLSATQAQLNASPSSASLTPSATLSVSSAASDLSTLTPSLAATMPQETKSSSQSSVAFSLKAAQSTPPPRTMATPTKATPTLCLGHIKNQLHGLMEKKSKFLPKRLWRAKGKASQSCDAYSSFVVVDMPDHASSALSQSFDSTRSHATQIRRQNGVSGEDTSSSRDKAQILSSTEGKGQTSTEVKVQRSSTIVTSRPPLTNTPTFKWQLQRRDFFDSIFHHDSKPLVNKVTVSIGALEDKRTLTFNLKLYPNGVNWDQDKSASLQVDVDGPSYSSPCHASCTLYMEVVLVELKGTSGHQMLAWRRQVCPLREKRAFILSNFIPHDVIKNSSAESFILLFNVNLSYSLGEDWIWVGAEEELGLMVDL